MRRLSTAGSGDYSVEVFFDGECPLCMREIGMLRRWDSKQSIRFTDIADPEFDAEVVGISWTALMDRIHGRLPDGTVIEGVEVFRRLYAAVGLGFVVALTRLPGISHVLDAAYSVFARHRLRLTGRCEVGSSPDGIQPGSRGTTGSACVGRDLRRGQGDGARAGR